MIVTFSDKKVAKVAQNFKCELCDYTCSKLNHFNKHLATQKHKKVANSDKIVTFSDKKGQKVAHSMFACKCGKEYRYRQGLSFHKKRCQYIEPHSLDIDDQSIITQLKDIIINQQSQIETQQNQIGDLIPRIGNNTITNNTTQNNKFSIKVFLDEKCKDAINMTDFVNSIKVSLEQLDYTKQYGLADGLSKTIMENMNRLTLYERPLHCTDVKRETLYIKDDDKWSKDDSRERMKRAIKGVTNANYRALKVWQGVHPEFRKDDRLTDYFTDTIVKLSKSLDGINDKVLKTICRSSYLKLADIE
jgi:hypothetical protein